MARAGDLDAPAVERVAWEGAPLVLRPEALRSVGEARDRMVAALAGGARVYGVTTGMGYLAGVDLSPQDAAHHQRDLLLGRAVGSPPYLAVPEARALVAVRLVNLLSGHAGVSPALCSFLADRLDDGFVPAVPCRGVGSAGEVMPLAHAFQTILGVGWVLDAGGGREPAAEALAARGVAPYLPGPKEGIALLAGAPGAAALGLARRRSAAALAGAALVAAACSVDAMAAPVDALDPAVGRLSGDPLLAVVVDRLSRLLDGSRPNSGAAQAPVSFRVIPQVHAHLERAVARLAEDAARAVVAVTDSPAFVDGRFVATGGFHAVDVAASLDGLAAALVRVAELSGQRLHRMLDSRFSGLPDQLTPAPGPRCGLVVVQKRVVDTLATLRRLAAPVSVGLADTSLGQEDAQSFAWAAADRLLDVEAGVREVLAGELLAARQAWALRRRAPAAGLGAAGAWLVDAVAPVDEDRPLGDDLDRLGAMVDELPALAGVG